MIDIMHITIDVPIFQLARYSIFICICTCMCILCVHVHICIPIGDIVT